MRLKARVRQEGQQVVAECLDRLAPCTARGATEQEALANLSDEVQFYLEKCPCSWMPDDSINFEIVK